MTYAIDSAPLPLYYRLQETLRGSIASGQWRPGDRVPSERVLSEQYGVSRMTARQAVTQLVHEGLLFRQQGKGTFVAQPRITQQLMRLTGFSEDMHVRGQRPGARVLDAGIVPAAEVAEHLRVDTMHRILRVTRLRFADAEPLAIETSHVSFIGCERLLHDDLEAESLYELLRLKYRVPLVEADQELEASLATDQEAQMLNVAVRSPVFRMRRTTYSDHKQPVEYAESVYVGAKYRFHTHLEHSGQRGAAPGIDEFR